MIKRYATLLFLSTLLVTGAYGQNFRQIGGRQAGLAYSGVALNDVWAYHNNPGMLGFLEESAAGVFYALDPVLWAIFHNTAPQLPHAENSTQRLFYSCLKPKLFVQNDTKAPQIQEPRALPD